MRSLGEMAIVARHSDKKIWNKFEVTVMFIGYANLHEKDVHHFMKIAIKSYLFF
jgi:hypothetical protein